MGFAPSLARHDVQQRFTVLSGVLRLAIAGHGIGHGLLEPMLHGSRSSVEAVDDLPGSSEEETR